MISHGLVPPPLSRPSRRCSRRRRSTPCRERAVLSEPRGGPGDRRAALSPDRRAARYKSGLRTRGHCRVRTASWALASATRSHLNGDSLQSIGWGSGPGNGGLGGLSGSGSGNVGCSGRSGGSGSDNVMVVTLRRKAAAGRWRWRTQTGGGAGVRHCRHVCLGLRRGEQQHDQHWGGTSGRRSAQSADS